MPLFEVDRVYCFGKSVCHETSHIFGTMYARILKFHVCFAYEKVVGGGDGGGGREKHLVGGIVFYKHITSYSYFLCMTI